VLAKSKIALWHICFAGSYLCAALPFLFLYVRLHNFGGILLLKQLSPEHSLY
jgi:hypothetical protein